MQSSLRSFFEPQGVAIVGASSNPNKLSNGILKNLKESEFQNAIAPVNPNAKEILGMKCYADISEIPYPIDLAVIVLPAGFVLETLEKCAKKDIHNVIVISGGFREIGEEGRLLEEKMLQIANENKIRIIGPNCVGTVNLYNGLNTTFIKGLPAKGGIGFISQSGAICGGIVDHVSHLGIGFSHIISLGNEADVDESDMIEYLAQDEATTVIAAYVEGIQDGEKFIRTVREVSAIKPIVVLKAGRSEQGARAVSSHTGSLAGSATAYHTAFKQTGAIEVNTTTDLLNVSNALDWMPLPVGNRVAIVTNSGGPAALASDWLADNDLKLAEISETVQAALREKLNPSAQVENPVDMLGGADFEEYSHALKHILGDDQVDMVLAILVPQSLVNPVKIADTIAEAAEKSGKPVLACLMGYASVQEAQTLFGERKIPMIDYPELCGPIFGALYKRSIQTIVAKNKTEPTQRTSGNKAIELLIEKNKKFKLWGEHLTRPVLDAYDITLVQGELIVERGNIELAANQIGYPVVLKIASQDVLHKSEFGGIIINIQDDRELLEAVEKINKNVKSRSPEARIEGYLLEKMAPEGKEVIVGFKRDPGFGPLLMFGLGGIFVELFKDVAFRIAPIDSEEAKRMVAETKAFDLLSGWRGGTAHDVAGVVDTILKINQLAMDNPEIQELEINPLMVLSKGSGVLALDCRLILKE
jgi:acetyl coenzyme A synthetase (ADP forming)-like protein